MSTGLGYPDWQKIQQWLGAPLAEQTGLPIGAGTHDDGPFNLVSWASVVVAVSVTGGNVTATVKQQINGGPASLELDESFVVSPGAPVFQSVLLYGDVVSLHLAGAAPGVVVDYALIPCNTPIQASAITNALVTVQQNDVKVDAEPTLDFEDASGWPWTITPDAANERVKIALPTPGLVKLWDSTEAGVVFPAASITTPMLSGLFKHLLIVARLRSDVAGADDTLYMRMNGIATANYFDQTLDAVGTGVTAFANSGVSLGRIGLIAAGGGAANEMGAVEASIPDYTGNQRKCWSGRSGGFTSAGFVRIVAGELANLVAAVTSLTFLCSGNLTGGRITVYGGS